MGLVSTHQLSTFTTPVNGTSPIDANQVKGNDNSIKTSYNAHDADTTIHLQSGAVATRPAASTAGQTWLATDSGAVYLWLDNGSAWVEANYLRSTGGTVTGAVTISDTTESTSTTTGALIVSGGVGIAKNVFIGGTLGVTGVATFTAKPIVSTLTASLAVFSDSVKGLVSNALTGTGNVVMSASPTLTGTIGAASMTLSGTLGVTGVATFTAQPIVSSLTASKPVFTDASKGLVSTGTLDTTQGGTNLTTYTTGDILYASATNVLSKLAIGTSGQHLIVTAGVPAWSTDATIGTVTSVSWTGGLVSVATATTTPAFTVAGTSGGVVYFSSASTWASSAALTASAIVLGGGAGAAPTTTTTGTGVVTALGVNVGTAGAFVVNGGALGTPSSGAVAASLITAGTFGAGAYTFPGALAITGAFTGATTGAFSGAVDMATVASVGTASVSSVGLYVRQINTLPTADVQNIASYISASSANTSSVVGYYGIIRTQAASFTCVTGRVIDVASPNIGAGSALTTLQGLNIQNLGASGITNAIGIDIAAQSGASTLNIGIRNAGTLTQTGAATFSSTLDVTGAVTFGNNVTQSRGLTGFNTLAIRNTTAGTGNGSVINMGNDTSAQAGALWCFSSTYSTTPGYAANGITLAASYAGGLSLMAENASGTVRIYAANTLAATFTGANTALAGTLGVSGAATFSSTVQIGTVSTLAQNGNSIYASRNFEFNLTYSPAITNNKDIGFAYVDNTHLRVYMKGSDGVTRSVDLTVA